MCRNFIRVFLISLLFCCVASVGAQQSTRSSGKLVGDVVYAFDGVPIPDAFVFVRGWGGVGNKVVALDAKGGFELPLPPGLYDVLVAAPAFVPICKRIAVITGQSYEFKARLRMDEEHMVEN